ncbi:MarR family winged helix-turn-helix transcriptional regulator [Pseudahrensia aquimaris]|uniref:MarR family winged helix-turn-helix transcriptional regulator n=1 Tax=Pseudahrensia aquimaris TaxID=744461 RepID=A0ABW3FEN2_9HYPH
MAQYEKSKSATPDDGIDSTLTFRLVRAANLMAQPFSKAHGERLGVTLPEWRCLMALAVMEGTSGEDIARFMGMEKMTVSRALRQLERNGHVTYRLDPTNKKRKIWAMTPSGTAIYNEILPDALARDKQAFASISDEQRKAVMQALDRFIAALE